MPVHEAALGEVRGRVAGDLGARERRGHVIVGHRLADGQFYVHYPSQPCGLCGRRAASAHPAGSARQDLQEITLSGPRSQR